MAGDIGAQQQKYWYAVAVFRDGSEVRMSMQQLCAGAFDRADVLILCKETMPSQLDGDGALPPALNSFLHAMNGNGADGHSTGSSARDQSRIYSHLLRDVAEGATVLIASATSAEQQLEGARLLLRGNSECVVTHEIVDRKSNVG
jgi:hypothetical protein